MKEKVSIRADQFDQFWGSGPWADDAALIPRCRGSAPPWGQGLPAGRTLVPKMV